MKSAQDIIVFARHPVVGDEFVSAAERHIEGECRQRVDNHYSDPSGQFHAGIWSGGLGTWRVKYSEHEFCTLLEGLVRVSDSSGREVLLQAGDHFVIPAGFEGVWQVLEPAKKTYAIFEAASAKP